MEEIINIIRKEIDVYKEISFKKKEDNIIILKRNFFFKIAIKKVSTKVIQIESLWNLGVLGEFLFKDKHNLMNFIGKSLIEKFNMNNYQIIVVHRNYV